MASFFYWPTASCLPVIALQPFLRSLRHRLVNLPRPLKQVCAISTDALLLWAAFNLALWIRFDLFFFTSSYLLLAAVAAVSGVGTLYALGLYHHILRYLNDSVALLILAGVLVSTATATTTNAFLLPGSSLSRAVLIIYSLLALGGLVGIRILVKRLLTPDVRHVTDARISVLVYGAGNAGLQLVTALQGGPHYRVAGIIDDAPNKHGLKMAGLKVHPPQHLPRLAQRHQVQQLLIAMPTATRARIREISEQARPYHLRVRLVPNMKELIDAQQGLRLRDLNVEDLLGRDPVAPIPALLARCVTGRAVMVTGAGGSIGAELCRQILTLSPTRLVLYDISEPALYTLQQELTTANVHNIPVIGILGSIRDQAHCLQHIRRHHIQTLYHAAAYKHVPIVEDNVAEGLRTNALGTHALAQAAIAGGVNDFVLISTDKAVRPTNVMGASKRLAELVLQGCAQTTCNTRFVMVRFGNVLGSSGSVIPLFHRQIQAGGPITLTHPDIIRYFMTIPEAAALVLQAGAMGESGSVYLLDMGEPVRIRDLAIKMIHLYGLTVRDDNTPDGDIAIRVTGLRPGEKLYEELLIGEDAQPTEHPKIMRAREHHLPYAILCQGLADLQQALDDDANPEHIRALLKNLVPEYAPSMPTAQPA